ncbi:MAG: hypothetical protein ACI4MI_03835 [Christensenellales bacterium]
MTAKQNNEQNDNESRISVLQKIKSVKHIEIIVAFVIAALAIFIYFISTGYTTQESSAQYSYSGGNELSKQVAQVLSNVEGVGNCNVLITYEDEEQNQIKGVVVVADGGDNVEVKIKIIDAVCALVDVKSDKIKIYKMNKA